MIPNKMFAYVNKEDSREEERSIICYASTNSCDRQGEMILSSAWTEKGLENYRKNPVILLNHDYHSLPIGKSLWQKVDGKGLKFKIQFAATDLGKELFYLYSNSYMNSFSVGFRPIKVYDNEEHPKYKDNNGITPHTVYEECELLELSSVTIPANADANIIRNMKSFIDSYDSGMFKTTEIRSIAEEIKNSQEYIELISKDIQDGKSKVIGFIDLKKKEEDVVEKVETTDKYHRIPINDKSLFVETSFRTIDISSDQGIKSIVGKLKSDPNGSTKIHTYLFDVKKWTMEKAKEWVDKHKEKQILLFSNKLDNEIKLTDSYEIKLEDLVQLTFDYSGITEEEWNNLEEDDREGLLEKELNDVKFILGKECNGCGNNCSCHILEQENEIDLIIDESLEESKIEEEKENSFSIDKDNRVKLLKFFIKYADKEIIDEFAKIISDNDEIPIEEILVKSLEEIKEQKKLICDLKNQIIEKENLKTDIDKKEINNKTENKDMNFIEIEIPEKPKEVEFEFDVDQFESVFIDKVKKGFSNIDLSELIDNGIKKAKGIIEFED